MIQDAPAIDAPYPGLRSFEPHEAAIFFGRGSHTATMLRLLGKQNFLAVVGSSGSGKSSLVRAGLLPAVADGYLNGQTAWRFVIVRPGDVVGSGVNTFGNLAAQLVSTLQPELLPLKSESASETQAYREATLRMGPNGLLDVIHDSLAQDESTHVFVLVDQFEEIFRYRDDSLSRDQQRQQHNDAVAFVDLLLSTAQARDPRVCVSLTMRSDFLGNCDTFHGLPQAINVGQFLTPRLTWDELQDVIELPLQVEPFRGTIDPQITAELLNEISDSQDLLPLLQHVLRRMWTMATLDGGSDRQTPHQITLEHFRHIGGLSHALDRHANDLYESMTTEQQRIAQRLFRCLSERSPQGQLTRRLTSVQEVADIAGVRPNEVSEVVDVFRRPGVHFLVTSPADVPTAATHIDISHESLLRQWKLLQQWIEEESEAASGYRRLIDAVKQGEKVIDGIRLDRFVEWRDSVKPTAAWARRYDGLVEAENGLLEPGLQLIDDSLAVREAKRQAAERDRLKREQAQMRELELAKDLAAAQTARARTFRRMLIAAALATAVTVVFAVVTFYARYEATKANAKLVVESTESKAAAFMAGLSGTGSYPSINEYEFLRFLADSDKATRLAFMKQMLRSAGKAERLRPRYPYVLHAVIGLDMKEKERIEDLLSEYGSNPSGTDKAINAAIAELGVLLAANDADFNKMVATNFVVAMEKTSELDNIVNLGQALGSLGEKLPGEQALTLAQRIVAVMEKTTDAYALAPLGHALRSLGEKLPREQALALAQRIVAIMEKTSDGYALTSLGKALGSLGEKLPGEQALAGAQLIVAVMEKTSEVDDIANLGEPLGSLGEKLPGEQALALAQRTVAVMKKTSDAYALASLGEALGSLGEKLPGEQALAGAQRIVAIMEKTSDEDIIPYLALDYLGEPLESLGEKLPGEQALALAQRIVAVMEKKLDADALNSLGEALGSLGEKLPGEQALALAQRIVAVMKKTSDAHALDSLGEALGSLGEKLPGEQAFAGAQRIVAVMENTSDADALAPLGRALRSLGEKLPGEQALAGAQRIVAVMENTSDADDLAYLGRALGSFGEKLPGEQAFAGAQRIVAVMENTSDADDLDSLGRALGSFGEKLPGEQAFAGAQRIVAVMENTSDVYALDSLGQALGSLGEKLPWEQALAGAQRIVAVMENTSDADDLAYLGKALGSFGEKLPGEQALALAQRIVAVMENTSDVYAVNSLGKALGSFGEKLPAEQALALAQRIVAVMENTSDVYALDSLGKALAALTVRLEAKDISSVLKSMICVGDTREKVLVGLEKKTGQKFDGNLWKAVEWLGGQGIDVRNVPRFPIVSPE